jgi:hypothetical protein
MQATGPASREITGVRGKCRKSALVAVAMT